MCKINQNLELESTVSLKAIAIQKPKEKEKRRNNEKRKEKSRDAARCRRSRETEIFTELGTALPVKPEDIDNLDKASVMRLAISYLKVRNMVELFPEVNNLDLPIDIKNENSDNGSEDEDSKEIKLNVLSKIVEEEKCALMALDGFLLVLSADGDITFVSENIVEYLGLTKIDLLGQPIWDYAHACDHDELRELLNGRKTSPSEVVNGSKSADCNPLMHRNMMLRLKCTLTKSGRFVNIKSASYKVIHLTGHIVFKDDGYRQLLAIGMPLAHPSNIEIPLGSSTLLTKHSLDMKFSFVDSPKMFELMGYKPEHLLGKSVYEFHHGNDSENLIASYKSLISKGQTETNRYRFLARNGGYVWIVTQATVVYEKQKPQSVVCINYVISGIENENEIYSCAQLEAQQELSKAVEASPSAGASLSAPEASDTSATPKVVKRDNIVLGISDLKQQKRASIESTKNSKAPPKTVVEKSKDIVPITTIKVNNCEIINSRPRSVTAAIFGHPTILTPHKKKIEVKISTVKKHEKQIFRPLQQGNPTSVTSKIFAPRTKDMNPGYLMFSEDTDTGLTMLKDEPDDLTHLAPLAGDECIQLDESAPFFSDMFDDFIIPDNYNLLTDELNSLDSQCSSKSTAASSTSSSCNDPFINYRDDSNDISNSPHLLSPGLSQSPDGNSIPSLCSPVSLPDDEITFMTLSMDDDLDMSMRAPYISMSESSELPLLISDDLMWGAQPDIKQTLNTNRKVDDTQNIAINNNNSNNHQQFTFAGSTTSKNASPSFDSSLTSLLCNQFLQQHQSEQITLNKHHPEAVINVMEDTSDKMDSSTDEIASNIEWTMNDLLQLKKPLSSAKINIREATTGTINQTQAVEAESGSAAVKKSTTHKRPSISYEISSKRAKGHDVTIKATPQLLQQLITTTGSNNQKIRQKISIHNIKSENRWSPPPVEEKQQQQKPAATNSVLMNLLVSGCDVPLTIDASQDFLEHHESLTSPIVINDKMLSHSAVSPLLSAENDGAQNPRQQQQNPSSGTKSYRATPSSSQEQKIIDAFENFIDSDALNKILMDLNSAQDFEANLF